ncbi:MAG TPA: SH3 domain-containing protein [Terriglobia bacterium]|nr:SH3 domain-containing protein [Terriglobia bacterium]
MKFLVTLLFAFLFAGCAPKPEPVLDQATVVAKNASLRLRNSSTSRTLRVLDTGEKVEVLERQENWYRVRYGSDVQGWMEESTVVTNDTKNRIQQLVAASQNEEGQNTAVVKQAANFRLEPGRSTPIIHKLESGTKIEVLERVTLPRPGSSSGHDLWLKVRPSPTEVGWILAGAIEFDIPADVSQYSEEYTYAAVKIVNRVQDPIAGQVNWYIIGERRPGHDPDVDFEGIRVFTWNMKKHRYETAFRSKGLRGVYPLEIGQDGVNPTFRIYELDEDGTTKTTHDYVMYGVIVRTKKNS